MTDNIKPDKQKALRKSTASSLPSWRSTGHTRPSGSVYNGEDYFYFNLKHIDDVPHVT